MTMLTDGPDHSRILPVVPILEGGGEGKQGNVRSKMAARAEHDSRIRQHEPVAVVSFQAPHNTEDEVVVLAGHHETDGKSCRVGGRGDEAEAPERAEGAFAFEVHVEHDTCIHG